MHLHFQTWIFRELPMVLASLLVLYFIVYRRQTNFKTRLTDKNKVVESYGAYWGIYCNKETEYFWQNLLILLNKENHNTEHAAWLDKYLFISIEHRTLTQDRLVDAMDASTWSHAWYEQVLYGKQPNVLANEISLWKFTIIFKFCIVYVLVCTRCRATHVMQIRQLRELLTRVDITCLFTLPTSGTYRT